MTPPSPGFAPGQVPAPGPPGCALCGCENLERRIGARSQPTPPRSGRRAGHAQCGRRAAVRQLGSSRSRAVGARTPAAASRRRPPPPDSGKLRGVPRALPEETDALLIKSNPIPPNPNPNHGGCGRRNAAAAGPCPLAGDQQVNCWGVGWEEELRPGGRSLRCRRAGCPGRRSQPTLLTLFPQPLEGQQRVKSAPRHREHGPLQPPRPPAARLGACPEPTMRHRSPAGV